MSSWYLERGSLPTLKSWKHASYILAIVYTPMPHSNNLFVGMPMSPCLHSNYHIWFNHTHEMKYLLICETTPVHLKSKFPKFLGVCWGKVMFGQFAFATKRLITKKRPLMLASAFACPNTYIYVYIYVYMYTHINVYINICTYVCIYINMYIYIHMYIHMHIHAAGVHHFQLSAL